jgi:hypothetical protein
MYPEADLIAEAEMCGVYVAMVTDYNKLKGLPHVSAAKVVEFAKGNVEKAQGIVRLAAATLEHECDRCSTTLDDAVHKYVRSRARNSFVRRMLDNEKERRESYDNAA